MNPNQHSLHTEWWHASCHIFVSIRTYMCNQSDLSPVSWFLSTAYLWCPLYLLHVNHIYPCFSWLVKYSVLAINGNLDILLELLECSFPLLTWYKISYPLPHKIFFCIFHIRYKFLPFSYPTLRYSLICFVLCRWHSFGRNPSNVWAAQFLTPTSSPDVLLLGTSNYHKCHQGHKKTSAPAIYFRHDSYPPCYSIVHIWMP